MIGSALRQSEGALTAKVSSRLDDEITARMWAMIAAAGDDPGDQAGESAGDSGEPGEVPGPEVWAAIRSDPGNVSLNTCKSERRKLDWIRAVGLPPGLFADIAPKIVTGWRARVAVEAPSHLSHPRILPPADRSCRGVHGVIFLCRRRPTDLGMPVTGSRSGSSRCPRW